MTSIDGKVLPVHPCEAVNDGSAGDDLSEPETAPIEGVIYSDQLHQPYPRRLSDLVTAANPRVVFRPWLHLRWKIFLGPRPAAIQIQWFDVILRRKSTPRAVLGAFRMVAFLLLARVAGIGTLVIFHNPVAKGHNRIALDRALRSALVAVGQAFVVLNPQALDVVQRELAPPFRPKFTDRAFVVPHPTRIVDHGPCVTMAEARRRLAIESTRPIVLQIPGANQASPGWSLEDPSRRYSLLRLERSDVPFAVAQSPEGFIATGRPSDEEFGLLISAAEAIVLTDSRAFGSATLHAAVNLGRPVIAPDCPATRELGDLGGAVLTPGIPTPVMIGEALDFLMGKDLTHAFEKFKNNHRDELVAAEAGRAYASALGLSAKAATRWRRG